SIERATEDFARLRSMRSGVAADRTGLIRPTISDPGYAARRLLLRPARRAHRLVTERCKDARGVEAVLVNEGLDLGAGQVLQVTGLELHEEGSRLLDERLEMLQPHYLDRVQERGTCAELLRGVD